MRRLAAVNPELAERSWLFYLSGEGEERGLATDLFDVLLDQAVQQDYHERFVLDPPPRAVCTGEYSLGVVVYPPGQAYGAFGLREDEWLKHVLIVGMTGAGKTTLAFHLLRQLRRKGKPFLVFDWKQSYRDLRQLADLADTRVYTVARKAAPFRFNPLVPPPGTAPGEWLMQLVDVLKHAYFVGEGVEYLLRRGIDWCYQHCGLFDEQPCATPTFLRVREYVQKQRLQGRMSLWKASAQRVLEALCFRHGLGPVLNTAPTVDLAMLLTRPVVLELDALADADKVFLTEALILCLYHYRKNHGAREVFHHALVIEEGHHILSQKKEHSAGSETIMETCLRQIREFGEAVVVIDQEPSKLSGSIKANTYTKIAFTLGNGADIEDITRCMRLTSDEANSLKLLSVGEAVVTLNGRTHRPLHVCFPAVPIEKGREHNARLKTSSSGRKS